MHLPQVCGVDPCIRRGGWHRPVAPALEAHDAAERPYWSRAGQGQPLVRPLSHSSEKTLAEHVGLSLPPLTHLSRLHDDLRVRSSPCIALGHGASPRNLVAHVYLGTLAPLRHPGLGVSPGDTLRCQEPTLLIPIAVTTACHSESRSFGRVLQKSTTEVDQAGLLAHLSPADFVVVHAKRIRPGGRSR